MKNRFVRFTLIGWLGAALQLALLTFLTEYLRLSVAIATALAVELAVLHNFLWHERFTWPDHCCHGRALRLWRFHLCNGLVSLVCNTALTYLLATWLHVPVVSSALVSIALCSFANFSLSHYWVYQDNHLLRGGQPESPSE